MDSTPHFSGDKTLVSSVMLMPGDPMRSKYIAEVFLQDAVMFNNVRGVNGYTGTYHGKRVSVSASGMGMPSIGVYSYEFFNFFGVEKVIRVGSAGAVAEGVGLRDIVIAQGACTDSAYANQFRLHGTYAPIADFDLLERAAAIAKEKKLNFVVLLFQIFHAFLHLQYQVPPFPGPLPEYTPLFFLPEYKEFHFHHIPHPYLPDYYGYRQNMYKDH